MDFSALPDAMDSKLKTVQHLKHLCIENGGKGKRLRQLQSQDDTMTHTWESLKTVPESALLAGGRLSKSSNPVCVSFPRTWSSCLEADTSRKEFSEEKNHITLLEISLVINLNFFLWARVIVHQIKHLPSMPMTQVQSLYPIVP